MKFRETEIFMEIKLNVTKIDDVNNTKIKKKRSKKLFLPYFFTDLLKKN